MGKKGRKKHLKRLNAPKVRRVNRKEKKYAVSASPGPHKAQESLPLAVSLRENLGLAKTKREAGKILGQGEVEVDGKVRRDTGFPVGLMDVVSFPKTGDAWRVLHDRKGYLQFHKIDDEESKYKLAKITDIVPFKGGKSQLTLHDGKSLIGDFTDFEVGDTVKITLPDLEIESHIPRKEGSLAWITGGSNVGREGSIKESLEVEGPSQNSFIIEAREEEFQSPERYVFVIGEEEPEISLP